MKERPYTKPGRLSDLLALIQVLAFDPDTHRSDLELINKELGPPSSTKDASWTTLAREHRELFRVSEKAQAAISLVARHVQPGDPNKKREPLTPEFTHVLIETAIELHDRQVAAAERWKHFIPLWQVLLGAVLVFVTSLATLHFSHPAKMSSRFIPAEGFGVFVLLDTETGQLCYTAIEKKNENSPSLPNCQDLH
jgi:hypothetical protein